jgi:hypothetical protein
MGKPVCHKLPVIASVELTKHSWSVLQQKWTLLNQVTGKSEAM